MSERNPWLDIPAADYEAHMGLESVRQLQALAGLFAETLAAVRPSRIAVPGCTTGNGLEHLDPTVTEQVLALDLNPDYLCLLRRRFARRLPGLVTVQADLRLPPVAPGAFDLVHCALVLEYLEPATLVAEMARWLAPGGVLSLVLQRPSESSAPVSSTPYRSLERLAPVMRLVPPELVDRVARSCRLEPITARDVPLPRGKSFWFGLFLRVRASAPSSGRGRAGSE